MRFLHENNELSEPMHDRKGRTYIVRRESVENVRQEMAYAQGVAVNLSELFPDTDDNYGYALRECGSDRWKTGYLTRDEMDRYLASVRIV